MNDDRVSIPPANADRSDGPGRPRSVLGDVLWVVALVAGALVVWRTRVCLPQAPYAFGSQDAFGYFLPAYDYEKQRIAAGGFPLWNPFQGAGVPFLATLQPGALYPARLLAFLTSPATAMGWSAFAHVLLALLGTYALCRRLGTSAAAAAAGAIVFTTAFALGWLHATTLLEPGAWLPCLAAGVVTIVSGGGWGAAVALGLGGAMPLLAGGYQPSVYGIYGLAVFAAAAWCERRRRGLPGDRGTLAKLLLAAMLALATAAPQLLTTLAWTAETSRQTRLLPDAQAMSLFTESSRWDRIATFFVRHTSADVCHLSVPVIALVAIGAAGRRPVGIAVVFGALATALIALVHPGSVYFPLYKAIPGFGMFRFPSRILVLTSLFAAVGTALGIETLTRLRVLATPARRRLVELAALGTVVVLLVWPYRNPLMLPWTVPASVTRPDARFFPGGTGPAPDERAWVIAGRYELGNGTFPRQGMRYGVRVLQDYEPLTSLRLAAFMHAVVDPPAGSPDTIRLFDGSFIGNEPIRHPELLDLVAVSRMMAAAQTAPAAASGWRELVRLRDLGIYRNDRALPRAYRVARARWVADEAAALATLTSSDFDGHGEAVLVGAPDTDEERALAAAPAVPAERVRIVADDPEHVALELDGSRPGLVVLADAFAPGWEATVDGAARRLWQANHLVRGVCVRAGDRRIDFRYHAPGFALGIAIEGIAWTVVLLALVTARVRRPATSG